MSSEFNFFQHWYPISPLEDLRVDRPVSFTLLGQPLVIWKKNTDSHFRVFLDRCPHRLAPLSEGRIEEKTGNLMCSYHGWQFDQQGTCACIPQADNPEIVAQNQDNFAAKSFPTREANDLLWVWADANNLDLAEKTPLPLSPLIDAEKGFIWSSMVRDLEYDWQTFIENVADPSHVPFAHHGIQGNRNQARPLPIEIITSCAELIEAETAGRFETKITFQPPTRLEYTIPFGDKGKRLGLITYCVPIMPGKCRIVAQFARNFASGLQKITPRWWEHIKIRNLVLEGDMILLHQQEMFLQQKEKLEQETWKTAYKMPASADRLVIEFRKWFDNYCGARLPWSELGISDELKISFNYDRRQLLDRYEQHTKHCQSCRNALKTAQTISKILLGYFILVLCVTVTLPDAYRVNLGIPLMLTGLMGLGIYGWLKIWLEPKFYFVDYIHAEKK
jgi:phenylpropionate dioxygenase-like ring-hydroxylating dioxygenase large terminal subunit